MELKAQIIEFILLTLTVSLSGVMAPGPMSAVAMNHGTQQRFAGLFIASGHAFVELPLIGALFFGIGFISRFSSLTAYITLAGSIVLFILGTVTIRDIRKQITIAPHSPLIDGIALTAFNPYFFIWWFTIGLSLIQKSVVFGLYGLVIFSILHVACDYVWLFLLSMVSFAGASFLGKQFKTAVSIITVVMLYSFGAYFLYDALRQIL